MGVNMPNNPSLSVEDGSDVAHLYLRFSPSSMRSCPFPWTMDERVEAFHTCMKLADADWPFAIAHYDKDTTDESWSVNEKCEDCNGVIYMNPAISPAEIISLAQQFGLLIEKMRYLREQDCRVIKGIRFNKSDAEKSTALAVVPQKTEEELIQEVLTIPYAEAMETKAAEEAVVAKPLTSAANSAFGFGACVQKGNSRPPSWEDAHEPVGFMGGHDERFLC